MLQLVFEKHGTSGSDDREKVVTVIAKEQTEGGFTITIPEIPEIISECDNEDQILDQVIDAFRELYKSYLQEEEDFPYNHNYLFEIEIIHS